MIDDPIVRAAPAGGQGVPVPGWVAWSVIIAVVCAMGVILVLRRRK